MKVSIEKFQVGQQIDVKRNPKTGKLQDRWIGPFAIIAIEAPDVYRLKLPETMKIHNVFHVSFLKAYIASKEFTFFDGF